MKWYEAKTLEEFDALPLIERAKMPNYLECRRQVAASFYDPFNDKKLAHLDPKLLRDLQRKYEAIGSKKDSIRRE